MTDPITVASWTDEDGATRAAALFTETFGYKPEGVWLAPGRVNLIGEHVDYNGGVSVPMALPHATYVAVSPRDDRVIRAVSSETGETSEVDLEYFGPAGSEGNPGGWMAYVAGVSKSLDDLDVTPAEGFDIAVESCVPLGSGLSSSAALECGLALAFTQLAGQTEDDDERRRLLADACMRAENVYAGAATGGMDQAVVLRAKDGHAVAFDSKTSAIEQIPLDLDALGYEILVIDTRAEHSLADGQYANRRAACEDAARKLSVEFLADIEDEDVLAGLEDDEQRARATHVVTEVARTAALVDLLAEGELDDSALRAVGSLMVGSHASLRDDYEVTVPELDVAVDAALAAGALGARMTGGGFGGSAIALVSTDTVDDVKRAVQDAFAEQGFDAPQFLEAVPSRPARRVK